MTCNLSHNSKHMVQSLLQRFPITHKERSELQPRTERAVFPSPDAGGESPAAEDIQTLTVRSHQTRLAQIIRAIRA